MHELWIKPEGNDGHYLIGGRGGRLDRSPHKRPTGQAGADDAMLETFAGELAHRFPGMAGGVWRGSWSSFYDFTPDGNPVIDLVPGRANLITATGMSGHCFKLAPSLGLGTAELVVDGERAQLRLVGVRLRALRAPRRSRRRRSRARMIGGVLLAAGAGSRFRAAGGGVKLLAPVDGRPLVERALAALADAPLGDRVIVLGAHADELLAAIDLHGARPCATSTGSEAWPRRCRPASRRSIRPARRRSSCWGTGPAWRPRRSAASRSRPRAPTGLVAATYGGGRSGHPVAIPRALWAQLPREGEQGARVLGEPAVLVDCSDLPAPGDADTPADLPA